MTFPLHKSWVFIITKNFNYFFFLYSPSTTFEEFDQHSDKEYYIAEKIGRSGSDCESVYNKCDSSLLEMFSQVFDPSEFFEFL